MPAALNVALRHDLRDVCSLDNVSACAANYSLEQEQVCMICFVTKRCCNCPSLQDCSNHFLVGDDVALLDVLGDDPLGIVNKWHASDKFAIGLLAGKACQQLWLKATLRWICVT